MYAKQEIRQKQGIRVRGGGAAGPVGTILGRFSVELHQEMTLGSSYRDLFAAAGGIPSGRYPIESDH